MKNKLVSETVFVTVLDARRKPLLLLLNVSNWIQQHEMSEQNGATSPTSGKKPARTIDRGARESQTLQTLQQNNTNNLRTMFESIGSQRDRNRGGTLPRNFGAKQFDQEEKSAYASQKEPVSRTTSATTSNTTSSTTSSSNSPNWKTASGNFQTILHLQKHVSL